MTVRCRECRRVWPFVVLDAEALLMQTCDCAWPAALVALDPAEPVPDVWRKVAA